MTFEPYNENALNQELTKGNTNLNNCSPFRNYKYNDSHYCNFMEDDKEFHLNDFSYNFQYIFENREPESNKNNTSESSSNINTISMHTKKDSRTNLCNAFDTGYQIKQDSAPIT